MAIILKIKRERDRERKRMILEFERMMLENKYKKLEGREQVGRKTEIRKPRRVISLVNIFT